MANYKFTEEDVRQHLNMQQDIINRMASNSSNCKTWLVTIVAALTALQITSSDIHNYGWLLVLVSIAFWYLDAFYLALERIHINNEKKFVHDLSIKDVPDGIYSFSTNKSGCKILLTIKAMWSTSCWPFYLLMIFVTIYLSWGAQILTVFNSVCCCHGA